MYEVYLIATMACSDAADIISRINADQYVSNEIKAELIEVIQESTPECSWDAND